MFEPTYRRVLHLRKLLERYERAGGDDARPTGHARVLANKVEQARASVDQTLTGRVYNREMAKRKLELQASILAGKIAYYSEAIRSAELAASSPAYASKKQFYLDIIEKLQAEEIEPCVMLSLKNDEIAGVTGAIQQLSERAQGEANYKKTMKLCRRPPLRFEPLRAERRAPDVFVSYCHKDVERAAAIAAALEGLQFCVWFDARIRPGAEFGPEIRKAAEFSRSVLVCWSEHASESEWVHGEAAIGAERDVLVACSLDGSAAPHPFDHFHVEKLNATTLDATNSEWNKIVMGVRRLIANTSKGRLPI